MELEIIEKPNKTHGTLELPSSFSPLLMSLKEVFAIEDSEDDLEVD